MHASNPVRRTYTGVSQLEEEVSSNLAHVWIRIPPPVLIWLYGIKAIMPDCLSGDQSSILCRVVYIAGSTGVSPSPASLAVQRRCKSCSREFWLPSLNGCVTSGGGRATHSDDTK